MKKCQYLIQKENKDLYYSRLIDDINGKRLSWYSSHIKDRVFDRNMVQGLCFDNFYGINKIIFKRKDKKSFIRILKNNKKYRIW